MRKSEQTFFLISFRNKTGKSMTVLYNFVHWPIYSENGLRKNKRDGNYITHAWRFVSFSWVVVVVVLLLLQVMFSIFCFFFWLTVTTCIIAFLVRFFFVYIFIYSCNDEKSNNHYCHRTPAQKSTMPLSQCHIDLNWLLHLNAAIKLAIFFENLSWPKQTWNENDRIKKLTRFASL